jgi:hypothetical protein
MITAFIIFFVVSLAIFLMLRKMPLPKRLGVSLALFLGLSAALYLAVVFISDKASPDAKTISPSETAK